VARKVTTLRGKYNEAKVFTHNLCDKASSQIVDYLDQDFSAGEKIRIMPDVHAGKGSVIGFTQTFSDKAVPNIVGVDIACGMLTVDLEDHDFSLEKLDAIIRRYIPSGHATLNQEKDFYLLKKLKCYDELQNKSRIYKSIGTLGGGNHFIEVNYSEKTKFKLLVVHSGSRNLGTQVAKHHQDIAEGLHSNTKNYQADVERVIKDLKGKKKQKDIDKAIKKIRNRYKGASRYPKDLCYLYGSYLDDYLHDMEITQKYATLNREEMINTILRHLLGAKLDDFYHFETLHNYIDLENKIIRKGAISARKGEKVLIPLNMRDGSLIAIGKGNEDWNYSAPHGAGRLYSRAEAMRKISLKDFQYQMKDVYSTSVRASTLDEAPQVYKPAEEIIGLISDTVEIIEQIKPLYNFKAS